MRKRPKAGDRKPERRSSKIIIWVIVAFTVIVMVVSAFNLPYSENDDATSEATTSENRLDILYLHGGIGKGTLLAPYPPGNDPKNVTVMNATTDRKYGHNILDRKYNSAIKPTVNIYVDSSKTEGMVLNFKLEFYMIEGNRLALVPVATAIFTNYTTKGTAEPELIELKSAKYEGTPVDVQTGEGYGASVRLTVWRTDDINDVELKLICGANDKISWVQIPYDRSLSSTKKDDNESTPMDSGVLAVVAIAASSLVVYYRKYGKY